LCVIIAFDSDNKNIIIFMKHILQVG